jgi:hypothetical protein
MFNKNTFKEMFRQWVDQNQSATPEEAREFCQKLIPSSVYASHYWLVEESLSWFQWVQKSRRVPKEDDYHDQLN